MTGVDPDQTVDKQADLDLNCCICHEVESNMEGLILCLKNKKTSYLKL